MLLIGFENLGQDELQTNYDKNFNIIKITDYQDKSEDWIIKYIEDIKLSINIFDITYIDYFKGIIPCLNALKIDYTVVYSESYKSSISKDILDDISKCKMIIISPESSLKNTLSLSYEWIKDDKNIIEKVESEEQPIDNNVAVVEEQKPVVINKNTLSLEELMDDNVEITESDLRDLKATQNKLKVGLLLQAKTMLRRVSKISDTLNKVYDELLDRVDNSIGTTDTASLMYTADYLSKALHDTNQFIISLINNEKIQNFFVIDNSTVINTTSDDRIDIDKREKIRKAVDIVMNNFDCIADGKFNELKNPNVIEAEVVKEEENADTTS